MSGLLLDTHIWWWYLTGSGRLPGSLRDAIDEFPMECWLSPISVWEFGMLAGRGRLRIPGSAEEWVGEALRRFPLREAALNHRVAVVSLEMALPHRDPADRFLASTAVVYDLILATADQRLIKSAAVPTRHR